MTALVGIAGGIGAGKSVVSRILDAMGYPVYDCDSRAKAIMDKDPRIHEQLCRQIHPLVVIGGVIDRRLLAEIVFNDPLALGRLNTIVHAAVEADVSRWVQQQGSHFTFVESAILYQCRLAGMVDAVIEVTASVELRVSRVVKRSRLSRRQILDRIASQPAPTCRHAHTFEIVNDDVTPILPQIHRVIDAITSSAFIAQ